MLCLILLCGCAKRQTEPQVSSLSLDADIQFGEYACKANIELGENGESRAVLLSPESVKDATVLVNGEGMTVSYMGLSYTPQMPLPNETVMSVLSSVFTSAATGIGEAVERDGLYCLEKTAAGYRYSLYLTESGLPVRLECDEAELYAEFSNVTLKK